MRSEIRVRAGVDALNVQSERETLDLKVWFKGDLWYTCIWNAVLLLKWSMAYFTAKEKAEYKRQHLLMLMKTHPGPVGTHTEIEIISTTATCLAHSHLAGEVCFN